MYFTPLVQASLTSSTVSKWCSLLGLCRHGNRKSLGKPRQDCRAAGESLAPLKRLGSGSWGRRCGLARCRGEVSNRSRCWVGRDESVDLTFRQTIITKGRFIIGKFPLQTYQVSHKTWWPSFVPTSDALQLARETRKNFTEKPVLTLRMVRDD